MIGASGWLFKNKYITMHGDMSVKFINIRREIKYVQECLT